MPASVIDTATALRTALASFDPRLLTGVDCARVADELAATEKACASARLLAAARAVEAGAHKECGFTDGAAWLARQSGTTAGRARQALDTAARLEDHPDTKQALLDGQISLDQAREITETPGGEKELLATARSGDLSQLREHAREHRQATTNPGDLRKRQLSLREFRHWQDRDGMVRFTGALPPESGLPFVRLIDKTALELRRAAKVANGTTERFEAYAADAFASMLSSADSGRPGRTPVELVIVCDLNAWRRGKTLPGEPCHILGGGPIPVELAKELARDPFLKAVLHDGKNIHTVRHFGRHIPAVLRTALDLGSPPKFGGRRCVGCGKTFRLQGDHANPLANGGATERSNIQDLCYQCQRTKTEEDRKAGRLGRNSPGGARKLKELLPAPGPPVPDTS